MDYSKRRTAHGNIMHIVRHGSAVLEWQAGTRPDARVYIDGRFCGSVHLDGRNITAQAESADRNAATIAADPSRIEGDYHRTLKSRVARLTAQLESAQAALDAFEAVRGESQ